LGPLAAAGYEPYLRQDDAAARLAAFGQFRILCAHRRGPAGIESVNPLVEAALAAERLLEPTDLWYPNRPLLVTRNDPAIRLFNGDVGLVVRDGEGRKALFPALEGDARRTRLLSLSRLPTHETAFALTVHKSQGSEFDDVVLCLPEKESPVLTRELLYTAVTRARRSVRILGTPAIVEAAVGTPTRRSSGLAERLWGRRM
ncbi:MAG: ATP-binding domain-containing protein, partial [Candidatus Binatia bacterium]